MDTTSRREAITDKLANVLGTIVLLAVWVTAALSPCGWVIGIAFGWIPGLLAALAVVFLLFGILERPRQTFEALLTWLGMLMLITEGLYRVTHHGASLFWA
jgi:hypothetical protein